MVPWLLFNAWPLFSPCKLRVSLPKLAINPDWLLNSWLLLICSSPVPIWRKMPEWLLMFCFICQLLLCTSSCPPWLLSNSPVITKLKFCPCDKTKPAWLLMLASVNNMLLSDSIIPLLLLTFCTLTLIWLALNTAALLLFSVCAVILSWFSARIKPALLLNVSAVSLILLAPKVPLPLTKSCTLILSWPASAIILPLWLAKVLFTLMLRLLPWLLISPFWLFKLSRSKLALPATCKTPFWLFKLLPFIAKLANA